MESNNNDNIPTLGESAMSAFYAFRQNNSGGSFVEDPRRGISVNVIVEAHDHEDANRRAERIGLYFDGAGDCSCCGDRWYAQWSGDGDARPSVYGTAVEPGQAFSGSYKWADGPEGYIHYLDGSVEPFYL